jgi:Heterokaryon incompatibility protein (HET)
MGIQYLWIDALCIIQKDFEEEDWYAESGQMRHIYANAIFCIAADVSESSTHGFIGKQSINPTWLTFSLFEDSDGHSNVWYARTHPKRHSGSTALIESALSKRGWALQESVLPSRILHFTSTEIIWECNMHCHCVCGDANYQFVKLLCRGITTRADFPSGISDMTFEGADRTRHINEFLAAHSPGSVYWAWETIVEYYTQRDLTNPADKLAAMSGLASVIVESLNLHSGAYLAGLWEAHLAKGLLWHVREPPDYPDARSLGLGRRYSEYLAPSWSWASIRSGVKYFTEHYQFLFQQNVDIIEAMCETSPLDPTGRVKSGHIVLRGQLAPITVVVERAVVRSIYEVDCSAGVRSIYGGCNGAAGRAYINQMAFVQSRGGVSYEALLDEETDFGTWENGYYCLNIGAYYGRHVNGCRIWWLVLKATPIDGIMDTRAFRRVGIGYNYLPSLYSKHPLFKAAKTECVMLV